MSDHDSNDHDQQPEYIIRPLERTDRDWVAHFLDEHWGSTRIVSRGQSFYGHLLPGFIAERTTIDEESDEEKPERIGLMLYNIEETECEILTLNSTEEGIGVGTALVATLREGLKDTDIERVWLITTNDNLSALKFWQKHDFVLTALHVDSIQEARRLKPQIPIIGQDGIPVRDELELEWRTN